MTERQVIHGQKCNPTHQDTVAHVYKTRTQDAEAGRSRVQGQPGLHETLLSSINK